MFNKIVVPVDGSEPSKQGLTEALKMATTLGSRLYLVHIVEEYVVDYGYSAPPYATALIESMREKGKAVLAEAVDEAKRYGLHAHATLVETVAGQAAELIVSHAQEIGADLIVMGTHGRRGLRRFALGSDAEQVARLAGMPVLLVRGETSDSPVTAKPRSSAPLATVELG